MKKYFILILSVIALSACVRKEIVRHHFTMQQYGNSEIQVCVNNPIVLIEIYSDETDIPYDTINNIPYKLSTEPNDAIEPFTVDYDYCLPQDRKIRNFSTKRIDNIEVCYERVSKIELPMSYCSPDTNVNVQVSQIQL